MAVKIDKGSALSALNLTPLIDMVFLLLIFFLVSTKFAEDERQMDVLLPDATAAQPLTVKPRELFVNIDQHGRYFVAGKQLDLPHLDQVLKTAWVNNPGRASVIIRADKRCQWEHVAAAMNACNRAKIRDYKVTTRESSV
jgi:biopolymer transport protein ExbD